MKQFDVYPYVEGAWRWDSGVRAETHVSGPTEEIARGILQEAGQHFDQISLPWEKLIVQEVKP